MVAAARTIVDSVILAAIARLAVVIGTPAMLGVLAWFAGNFIALREVAAVHAATQARLVAEMSDLQTYRRDAYARGEAMRREDAAIRETLRDVQQALNRLTDRIDRVAAPPRGNL